MNRKNDILGRRFGMLTAIEELPMEKKMRKWRLQCDCGEVIDLLQKRFVYLDGMKSCGCSTRKQEYHGKSHSSEYTVWKQMKFRCTNPNASGYENYGGRGIKVCAEWERSFTSFLRDVGPRPSMSHTLDRINNDKGYEPSNVRWADPKTQGRNTSTNRVVEVDGKRMSLAEAVEERGLRYNTVLYRILRGKTPQEAIQ